MQVHPKLEASGGFAGVYFGHCSKFELKGREGAKKT